MNASETVGRILPGLFAFAVLGGCLWFLYLAFLDPNTAALPEQQQNVIVAGIFGLLGSTTTYMFTVSAAGSAPRASERAGQAGANAALATPPSVAAPPEEPPPPPAGPTRG